MKVKSMHQVVSILATVAGLNVAALALGDGAATAQEAADAVADPRLERSIAFWQARVTRNPRAYVDATLLGEALTEKARATGAIELYGAAAEALQQALEVTPTYTRAQLALAFVLVQRHEFEAALALLEPIRAAGAGGLQTRAYLADVYLALGRYDEARELIRVREIPPSPAMVSRRAGLASLEGNVDQALELLAVARDLSARAADPPSVTAYYEFHTGELYLHRGRLAAAERHYRAAMTLAPYDPLPWLGMGEVASARGDTTAALRWLRRAESVAPDPEILARLGDLHAETGDMATASRYYDRVEALCSADADRARIYRTFLANFYADRERRLDTAFRLALVELARRQDVETVETAAWVLHKAGDNERARSLMQQALRTGSRDAELLYRAGQIARASGNADDARTLFAESKALDPYYRPPLSGL